MTGSTSNPIPVPVTAVLTAAAGGRPYRLPPDERQGLVELLTRLVINPEHRDAYCQALRAKRVQLGVHRSLIAAGDSGDVPEEEIARSGFGWLTDEQLVDYAVSPAAVEAIAERLCDDDLLPELGDWFIQASQRDVRAESVTSWERETPPDRPNIVAPTASSEGVRRQWLRLALPAAVAASLLLAFYLGTRWTADVGRRDVRLASVTTRGEVGRGIEHVVLQVRNSSDRRVYLSIVGLVPGRKSPGLFHRSGQNYIEVPPGATSEIKNLPPAELGGSEVLLVVATDVPAGDVVRNAVPPLTTPDTADRAAQELARTLNELGIGADVRVVSLSAGKR